MNVNIEIKIKMDNGKEVTLKEDEAKELFLKLKGLYEMDKVTEYPYIPPVIYPNPSQPVYPWYTIWSTDNNTVTWGNSKNNCTITCY